MYSYCMCGIAGLFGSRLDLLWLNLEIERLSNRGPDSQRVVQVSPMLSLGASRLAMTDAHPRSNQPMSINSGTKWIVFNGEIYNFRKLKTILIARGINFDTESDTEVLAKWLNEFGVLGINELEGMFSFAYFDKIRNRLYLGRDSLGKKPLYWVIHKNCLYWSSSSEHLPSISAMGKESLMSYLRLGYLLDSNTSRIGVKSIAPGAVLEFDERLEFEEVNLSRFPIVDISRETSNFAPTHLRQLLIDAVDGRVSGHDEVALSLSGGVDSTIIGVILKILGKKVHTFSANWEDSDKDKYNVDSKIARRISDQLEFKHSKVNMFSSSEVEIYLDLYLAAMSEPNNNASGLSLYSLYSRIGQSGCRLVLTGDGADEIFGGYERHLIVAKSIARSPFTFGFLAGLSLKKSAEKRTFFDYTLNSLTPPTSIEHWLFWHQIFSINEITRLMGKQLKDDSDFIETLNSVAKIRQKEKAIRIFLQRDHQIWLVNESNKRLDRISMAHSVEARCPFQDENVIEYAYMTSQENPKTFLNKSLLRKAFPEISTLGVRNDKFGFISPIGHWLRSNPNLVKNCLDSLGREHGFNNKELKKYEDAPTSGNFQQITKLWSLVVLSKWLQNNHTQIW